MMRVTGLMGPRANFMPQVFRAAHMDAGGRPVAVPQLMGNELAFQQLRDSWPLVPGTRNTVIIEDRTSALSEKPINKAIFDWDETVSMIKCGWNIAMIKYVAKLWAMPENVSPSEAWGQNVEPTEEDIAFAEEIVRRTTGTLTQVQYATAIHLKQFRIPGVGGIDRDAFEKALDGILVKSQLNFTNPSAVEPWDAKRGAELWDLGGGMYKEWKNIMKAEFRDRRLEELRSGAAEPEQYLVGQVIPFLGAIHEMGIPMFALSGSEQSEVEEDARALTAGHYFETIFGVNGTLERLTRGKVVYSKYNGSKHIIDPIRPAVVRMMIYIYNMCRKLLENIGIVNPVKKENNIDRIMWLGDGPSEIKIGKTFGGLRVGLVPAHAEDPIALAGTLIDNGAQYLILQDFSDWEVLVPYFFGK